MQTQLRITINSSENVGIGRTDPSAILHIEVADNTEFLKATITGNESWAFKGASGSGATDYVSFGLSGSTQCMTWQENGNVGIGTTSPTQRLDVNGNIAVGYDSSSTHQILKGYATNHASSNQGGILQLGVYDGSFAGIKVVNTASSVTNYNSQYISFETHEGAVSAAERMRITQTGNVGIAGVPPSDVNTNYPLLSIGETTVLQGLNDSNESFFSNNAIWKSDNSWEYVKDVRAAQIGFADGTTLFRQVASGTAGNDITWSESMRIDTSGNVGIGTSSPSTKLDVNGAIRLTDSTYQLYSSSASAVIGNDGNTANDLNIYSSTSGHNGLRFHVNGILPTDNTGTIVDADANLGESSYRFKNLYLSSQALVQSGATTAPSFAFTNDTDTGISRPTSDTVNICTAGSERVRINSTGFFLQEETLITIIKFLIFLRVE